MVCASRLKDMGQRMHRASCAVITRPPEIISCFYIPYKDTCLYVIFDSHPRPNVHPNGAAFIIYAYAAAAASYLAELMAFDPALLAERGVQWQAQLLGHFSGHIFLAPPDAPDARSWEDAALEASLQLLSARAAATTRENELQSEITALRLLLDTSSIQEVRKRKTTRTIPLPPSPDLGSRPQPRKDGIISDLFERGSRAFTSGENASSISREPSGSKARSPVTSRATSHSRAASYGGDLGARANGSAAQASTSSAARWTPIIQEPIRPPTTRPSHVAGKTRPRSVTTQHATGHLAAVPVWSCEVRATIRRDDSTSTFRCGVCFDNHTLEDVAEVSECGHRYCRDCLHRYVVAQVEARVYPMKCPSCMVNTNDEHSGEASSRADRSTLTNNRAQCSRICWFNSSAYQNKNSLDSSSSRWRHSPSSYNVEVATTRSMWIRRSSRPLKSSHARFLGVSHRGAGNAMR